MKSLQGCLLVASHELMDPNFHQTVVLMVQHSSEGALGLVLNRPTNTAMSDAWKQISETPCQADGPLHLGGPCRGPLMAIHTEQDLAELAILPGLYFSAEAEHVQGLIARQTAPVKFFIGFSGWGPGQLESELDVHSWLTTAASSEHTFDGQDDLWARVVRQIAGADLVSALRIKHVPDDPSMN